MPLTRPGQQRPGNTARQRRDEAEAARGRDIRLVPTWRGAFGPDMAGEVLLPGKDARLGTTTFEDWLAAGADDAR